MKKHLLLSKQGFFFRFISTFFQCLIILPISVLFSVIITLIVTSFCDINGVVCLKYSFFTFNVLWVIYNSFIRIYDDKIVLRSWIGEKLKIDITGIRELKIISSKELRKILFNRTGVDPLITNAFVLIIPMGSFLTFKNSYGRDVIIGVWNVKKLYKLLIEKASSDEAALESYEHVEIVNELKSKNDSYGNLKCFVKMPLKSHILVFFSHFYETILLPVFMVLIFMWLFNRADIEINRCVWMFPCLLISAFRYYHIIRVTVEPASKTIKLNLYNNDDKNVIKYDSLKNLCKHSQLDISKLNNRYSEIICSVPYSNKIKNPIVFEIANNKFVVLSVDKSQELYDLIRSTGDGLCTEA